MCVPVSCTVPTSYRRFALVCNLACYKKPPALERVGDRKGLCTATVQCERYQDQFIIPTQGSSLYKLYKKSKKLAKPKRDVVNSYWNLKELAKRNKLMGVHNGAYINVKKKKYNHINEEIVKTQENPFDLSELELTDFGPVEVDLSPVEYYRDVVEKRKLERELALKVEVVEPEPEELEAEAEAEPSREVKTYEVKHSPYLLGNSLILVDKLQMNQLQVHEYPEEHEHAEEHEYPEEHVPEEKEVVEEQPKKTTYVEETNASAYALGKSTYLINKIQEYHQKKVLKKQRIKAPVNFEADLSLLEGRLKRKVATKMREKRGGIAIRVYDGKFNLPGVVYMSTRRHGTYAPWKLGESPGGLARAMSGYTEEENEFEDRKEEEEDVVHYDADVETENFEIPKMLYVAEDEYLEEGVEDADYAYFQDAADMGTVLDELNQVADIDVRDEEDTLDLTLKRRDDHLDDLSMLKPWETYLKDLPESLREDDSEHQTDVVKPDLRIEDAKDLATSLPQDESRKKFAEEYPEIVQVLDNLDVDLSAKNFDVGVSEQINPDDFPQLTSVERWKTYLETLPKYLDSLDEKAIEEIEGDVAEDIDVAWEEDPIPLTKIASDPETRVFKETSDVLVEDRIRTEYLKKLDAVKKEESAPVKLVVTANVKPDVPMLNVVVEAPVDEQEKHVREKIEQILKMSKQLTTAEAREAQGGGERQEKTAESNKTFKIVDRSVQITKGTDDVNLEVSKQGNVQVTATSDGTVSMRENKKRPKAVRRMKDRTEWNADGSLVVEGKASKAPGTSTEKDAACGLTNSGRGNVPSKAGGTSRSFSASAKYCGKRSDRDDVKGYRLGKTKTLIEEMKKHGDAEKETPTPHSEAEIEKNVGVQLVVGSEEETKQTGNGDCDGGDNDVSDSSWPPVPLCVQCPCEPIPPPCLPPPPPSVLAGASSVKSLPSDCDKKWPAFDTKVDCNPCARPRQFPPDLPGVIRFPPAPPVSFNCRCKIEPPPFPDPPPSVLEELPLAELPPDSGAKRPESGTGTKVDCSPCARPRQFPPDPPGGFLFPPSPPESFDCLCELEPPPLSDPPASILEALPRVELSPDSAAKRPESGPGTKVDCNPCAYPRQFPPDPPYGYHFPPMPPPECFDCGACDVEPPPCPAPPPCVLLQEPNKEEAEVAACGDPAACSTPVDCDPCACPQPFPCLPPRPCPTFYPPRPCAPPPIDGVPCDPAMFYAKDFPARRRFHTGSVVGFRCASRSGPKIPTCVLSLVPVHPEHVEVEAEEAPIPEVVLSPQKFSMSESKVWFPEEVPSSSYKRRREEEDEERQRVIEKVQKRMEEKYVETREDVSEEPHLDEEAEAELKPDLIYPISEMNVIEDVEKPEVDVKMVEEESIAIPKNSFEEKSLKKRIAKVRIEEVKEPEAAVEMEKEEIPIPKKIFEDDSLKRRITKIVIEDVKEPEAVVEMKKEEIPIPKKIFEDDSLKRHITEVIIENVEEPEAVVEEKKIPISKTFEEKSLKKRITKVGSGNKPTASFSSYQMRCKEAALARLQSLRTSKKTKSKKRATSDVVVDRLNAPTSAPDSQHTISVKEITKNIEETLRKEKTATLSGRRSCAHMSLLKINKVQVSHPDEKQADEKGSKKTQVMKADLLETGGDKAKGKVNYSTGYASTSVTNKCSVNFGASRRNSHKSCKGQDEEEQEEKAPCRGVVCNIRAQFNVTKCPPPQIECKAETPCCPVVPVVPCPCPEPQPEPVSATTPQEPQPQVYESPCTTCTSAYVGKPEEKTVKEDNFAEVPPLAAPDASECSLAEEAKDFCTDDDASSCDDVYEDGQKELEMCFEDGAETQPKLAHFEHTEHREWQSCKVRSLATDENAHCADDDPVHAETPTTTTKIHKFQAADAGIAKVSEGIAKSLKVGQPSTKAPKVRFASTPVYREASPEQKGKYLKKSKSKEDVDKKTKFFRNYRENANVRKGNEAEKRRAVREIVRQVIESTSKK